MDLFKAIHPGLPTDGLFTLNGLMTDRLVFANPE